MSKTTEEGRPQLRPDINATRRRRMSYSILTVSIFVIAAVVFAVWFVFRPFSLAGGDSIPQGWGYGWIDHFSGGSHVTKPMAIEPTPHHPFLASTPSSNMHADSYGSGIHPVKGPLGVNMVSHTFAWGRFGGECATMTFDSKGRIVAVCATFTKFSVVVFSPETLMPIASFDLPGRASSKSFNLRKIMTDTSGGAYFFLDHQDRTVLVDAKQRLRVIAQQQSEEGLMLVLDEEYDLNPLLEKHDHTGDLVTAVFPDWQGRYWFVSRNGLIGNLDPADGRITAIELSGEKIQNALTADRNAIYLSSDHALYALNIDSDGKPQILWREAYQRATKPKPGAIDLGSGTTPTLIGEKWIAITDNAEPRINVLIYKREPHVQGPRLVCRQPLFAQGKSAVETSLIGFNNTIIVANNYGYDLFPYMMFGHTGAGGVARIDFNPDRRTCREIWFNPVIAQSALPKLGRDSGLVYLYTKNQDAGWGIDAYSLTALDAINGQTVFSHLVGTGVSHDNNWGTTALGGDNCAYVGVLRGIAQVCDKVPAQD